MGGYCFGGLGGGGAVGGESFGWGDLGGGNWTPCRVNQTEGDGMGGGLATGAPNRLRFRETDNKDNLASLQRRLTWQAGGLAWSPHPVWVDQLSQLVSQLNLKFSLWAGAQNAFFRCGLSPKGTYYTGINYLLFWGENTVMRIYLPFQKNNKQAREQIEPGAESMPQD